jgi:predicted regulator of Ras-like GTPase activity (Roadblock/LC7/MglB family)
MAGFDALLKAAPDLRAVAKADKGGNVQDMAGDADAETVCAVVALALKSLDEVEELVGLGNMRSWTIASSKVTLYVQHQPDGFVAALGGPTKNAEATMRIVTEHAGAGAGGRR